MREITRRALDIVEKLFRVHEMSESSDIRVGLLRRRVSLEEFAEQCGLSVNALEEELGGDSVGDGVLSAYAALVAKEEGFLGEKPVKEGLVEPTCVFGRPVTNDRIQIVVFSDGRRDGMLRKKRNFKPRHGLPCEVRESGEEGWLELVGSYRDNGVRLS